MLRWIRDKYRSHKREEQRMIDCFRAVVRDEDLSKTFSIIGSNPSISFYDLERHEGLLNHFGDDGDETNQNLLAIFSEDVPTGYDDRHKYSCIPFTTQHDGEKQFDFHSVSLKTVREKVYTEFDRYGRAIG